MRKYLIGVIAGLVGALALSSVASAAVTGLRVGANVTPSKQDKKVRGGASVFFESNDTHAGALLGEPGCIAPNTNTPACLAFPPSTQTVLTFPTDFKFDPGNLPDCNLARIAGQPTAGAKAACPGSVVGGGSNVNKTLAGGTLNGVITAFNGAPSGGAPSLYLHVDIAGVTTKPILNGVIRGNVLTVQIPPVPGAVIEHFDTTINRIVSKKTRNRRTGKVKKTFYFSAKCSKRTWATLENVTYQNGQTLSSSISDKCTQKK